jgi:hypothetical protein
VAQAQAKRAKPVQRKLPLLAIGAAALLGVVITVAILVLTKEKPEAYATTAAQSNASPPIEPPPPVSVEPPPPATATVVAVPSVSVAPAPSASAASVAERTVLSIDTVPAHATISINGEKKGKSPIEVKVPKSSDELVIEIQHPGYVTMKERVVPDVNQRLKLQLVASGAGSRPASKPGASNPSKKFE